MTKYFCQREWGRVSDLAEEGACLRGFGGCRGAERPLESLPS